MIQATGVIRDARQALAFVLPLLAMLAAAGCQLYPARLTEMVDTAGLPRLDLAEGPIVMVDGNQLRITRVIGLECPKDVARVPYDRTLWAFTKQAVVRGKAAGSEDIVLIDTGLNEPARVTLDVVARCRIAAHLDPPRLAYAESLQIGDLKISGLPARIEDTQWQVRFLCFPIYRHSGWALGTPILRSLKYLLLDNAAQEAAFGCRSSFRPGEDRRWESFPMSLEKNATWVEMPIAGVNMRIVADTGGGPGIIANQDDWEKIKPHVRITGHNTDKFPTWGGFQAIDVYTVAEIEVGPVKVKDAKIWVRQGSFPLSTVGLGVFENTTVVFDFEAERFWVKKA